MAENASQESGDQSKEQVVTPWTAHAGEGQATIDYDKLIGTSARTWLATLMHASVRFSVWNERDTSIMVASPVR